MPTVLYIDGFRFHFFSDERNEPCHIHIKKGGARAKIWLIPEYNEEYFYDFTVKEKKKIKEIVKLHQDFIIEKWNEYFGKSSGK